MTLKKFIQTHKIGKNTILACYDLYLGVLFLSSAYYYIVSCVLRLLHMDIMYYWDKLCIGEVTYFLSFGYNMPEDVFPYFLFVLSIFRMLIDMVIKKSDTPYGASGKDYDSLSDWWKRGVIGTYKRNKVLFICYIIYLIVPAFVIYGIGWLIWHLLEFIWIVTSGAFSDLASDGSVIGFIGGAFMFVFCVVTILYIIIRAIKNF